MMELIPTPQNARQASEDWGRTYYDPVDIFRMGLSLINARALSLLMTKGEWEERFPCDKVHERGENTG